MSSIVSVTLTSPLSLSPLRIAAVLLLLEILLLLVSMVIFFRHYSSLIVECSDKKFNLLKIDTHLYELEQYTDNILKKEKELNVKEKY